MVFRPNTAGQRHLCGIRLRLSVQNNPSENCHAIFFIWIQYGFMYSREFYHLYITRNVLIN